MSFAFFAVLAFALMVQKLWVNTLVPMSGNSAGAIECASGHCILLCHAVTVAGREGEVNQ